ncbi:hypothetical protein S21ZY_129 [Pseudomonas phage ZY21]|nr:hypothetical protein S21ZY_129 [Pseudomonas phage ZY21]
MKPVTTITEVPEVLKPSFPTLAELHEVLELSVADSMRSDELMAKMLKPMSSWEAKETRDEIHAIALRANARLKERFERNPLSILGMVTMLMTMRFGMMMATLIEESDRHLTVEQAAMLKGTGAFDELLRGKSQ